MQLSARPLLDNARDQALFVGRTEALQRIARSLQSGLNCLLVGDPGSGKTSLIRALMYRFDESAPPHGITAAPLRFTYVRANDLHSSAGLLAAVLSAIRSGSDVRIRNATAEPELAAPDVIDELARMVDELPGDDSATRIVVVDDLTATVGAEVFGAMRDELWQVDVRWLVTTSTAQVGALLRPPADVFFETRVELGPLTVDEATELLRRRSEVGGSPSTNQARNVDEYIDSIATTDSARETPRRLLEVARELLADPAVGGDRLNVTRGLATRAAALEKVSRPARMLAQELDALGWASASDERLLARMGWTRPRVVQVLGELEAGGLVEMREESTGRGRPRKLFRLIPPAEFPRSADDPGSESP